MSKVERKSIATYTDHGFGFPVVLEDVSMIKVRGKWTPEIDYNLLAKEVLRCLAELDGRLTGNQVKFIRLQMEMTLEQFAKRLGLSHPAVLKWEKKGDAPTGMNWSNEKDIRLFIAMNLSKAKKPFFDLYEFLETVTPERARKVKLEANTIAA